MQVFENYHEPGMEIHEWEVEIMKTIKSSMDAAMARAISLEESERRNNAGSH